MVGTLQESVAIVHVGDVGFPIRIQVKHTDASGTLVVTNISSATLMQIKLLAPDGDQIVKLGDFVTDGADGEFEYVVEDEVLDIEGFWKVQGYLELAGWSGHTDVGRMEVQPVLF